MSQQPEGIEFVKKNLNYIDFMDNIVEIFNDANESAKESILLILACLCYEKSLIKVLFTKQDHFNFLYNTLVYVFSYRSEALLANAFKLAINLSADPTINTFLSR